MFKRVTASAGATIAAVLVAAAALGGCNDDPTGIGSGYLPENVTFHTYRAAPSAFSFISGFAAVASSSSRGATGMLVGRAEDGTVAHSLMVISDSLKRMEDPGATAPTSVTLRLRSYAYRYPAGPAQVSFDVVAVDEVALDTVRWNPSVVAAIEGASVLGTYTADYTDSLVANVTLDPVAFARFFREAYTYDTTITLSGNRPDTLITRRAKKSLALRARNDARSVVAFVGAGFGLASDSLRPTVRVAYADTSFTLTIGVSSFIADYPVEVGPGRIVLGGGRPIRTWMGLRVDLPRGATIHQARLRLHVDTARSRHGSSGVPTYAMLFDADNTALQPETYLQGARLANVYGGYRATRDSASFADYFTFSGPAASLTANMRARISGGDSTAGFVMSLSRGSSTQEDLEAGSVDRLVFHGFDAADSTKWPELTLIYSTQNDVP